MAVSRDSGGVPANAPKMTPLPVRQLTILCIVLLTESICSTMLIPFVGYYVSFMTGWEVEKAGYRAGYLVGSFMLGQVISSKMWGTLSEKVGRKVSIAIGVFGCGCAVTMFGLSTNVYMCAFWRLVHGLSAGCSLVAKAMIADVTDRTNQAKGYALVSLTWGVGTLIGPSVGGWTYDPTNQSWLSWLHLSKEGFLARHPAFLPSFIAALYNFFAVAVCVIFLTESNKNARPIHSFLPSPVAKILWPCLRVVQPWLPGYDINDFEGGRTTAKDIVIIAEDDSGNARHDSTPADPDRKSSTGVGHRDHHHHPHHHHGTHPTNSGEQTTSDEGPTTEDAVCAPRSDAGSTTTPAKRASFGFKQAFQNPVLRCVCCMSMLISASDMMYAETFPLWAVAPVNRGGLGLSTAKVGVLILANSFPAVVGNLFFATALRSFTNEVLFWNCCQVAYALTTVAIPPASTFENNTAGFVYCMAVGMSRKVSEAWTFAMIMLVVAQTAPPGRVSVMYGIQQATACAVRCVVPFTFAPLFAWSISTPHPFPFNHWLLFLLCVIPLAGSVILSRWLVIPPEEDDLQHRDGADLGDDSDSNEHMATESMRNFSFGTFASSHHTFRGSFHPPGEGAAMGLLKANSYASLAHSFATNMVPGILNSTIMPPLMDLASTHHDGDRHSEGEVEDEKDCFAGRNNRSRHRRGKHGHHRHHRCQHHCEHHRYGSRNAHRVSQVAELDATHPPGSLEQYPSGATEGREGGAPHNPGARPHAPSEDLARANGAQATAKSATAVSESCASLTVAAVYACEQERTSSQRARHVQEASALSACTCSGTSSSRGSSSYVRSSYSSASGDSRDAPSQMGFSDEEFVGADAARQEEEAPLPECCLPPEVAAQEQHALHSPEDSGAPPLSWQATLPPLSPTARAVEMVEPEDERQGSLEFGAETGSDGDERSLPPPLEVTFKH